MTIDFKSAVLQTMYEDIIEAYPDYYLLSDNEIKRIIQAQIFKRIKFLKILNSLKLQLLFYKIISFYQDTNFIDKTLLKQNTYYKTITSRP